MELITLRKLLQRHLYPLHKGCSGMNSNYIAYPIVVPLGDGGTVLADLALFVLWRESHILGVLGLQNLIR